MINNNLNLTFRWVLKDIGMRQEISLLKMKEKISKINIVLGINRAQKHQNHWKLDWIKKEMLVGQKECKVQQQIIFQKNYNKHLMLFLKPHKVNKEIGSHKW